MDKFLKKLKNLFLYYLFIYLFIYLFNINKYFNNKSYLDAFF